MQKHLFRTFEPSTCTSVYQIPCFTYYFQQQQIWGEKCERTFCEKEIGKGRERKSERKTSFYLPEFGGRWGGGDFLSGFSPTFYIIGV